MGHNAAMETRTLKSEEVGRDRLDRAFQAHVESLNQWTQQIQRESGHRLPYFDPADGGVEARVLLLLESPGPVVSRTQFVSVDNPDGTAENMRCLLHLSGLRRSDVVLWNAVPWQMSENGVVTPRPAQYAEAAPLTREVLALLPRLQAVVLVGKHAQQAWLSVGSSLPAFPCPHPSPQNFNSRREEAAKALTALVGVYGRLLPPG